MASAWREPSGRDDRSDSLGFQPDENQLDLFEILPRASSGTAQPSASSRHDGAGHPYLELSAVESVPVDDGVRDPAAPGATELDGAESGAREAGDLNPHDLNPYDVEMLSPAGAHFIDAGISDADDMRRLEESIRWLMSAGMAPMPQTTLLPPVPGLATLDGRDDHSLLLDPETLFPPRAPRRRSGIVVGAAKVLLVSAIAAPTAYFVASWLQFPGAAAPSDPAAIAAVATPVALPGDQVAEVTPVLSAPEPPAVHNDGKTAIANAPPPEPPPANPADTVVVMAAATPRDAVAPEPPTIVATAPAEAVSPPLPVALPPKPAAFRAEEVALMVERGRVLFEAGDVAAARLFFRRAANAGEAAAAFAMGATYDPDVLAQRFIRGIEANAEEAQRWYQKAREMSLPATGPTGQHIEMLAQRR
jgi:hypothetical protein